MALPLGQDSGGKKRLYYGSHFSNEKPVAGLASFLSHDTVSVTIRLFTVPTFHAPEQIPKALKVNVAEQLTVWEMKRHVNLLHGVASGRR